ncbi:MAG: hypothetical protein IJD14_02145 [Christensenellaceae bacterium]|nr:hypothetical protein [Christensenellaceae bacterium]
MDGSPVFSIDKVKNAYNYRNQAYSVSSSKLGKDIPVVVTYNFAEQEKKSITKSFKIAKGASAVSINTSVTSDKTTIQAGDTVNFSFSIENTSEVAIQNAKLTATGLNSGAQIGSTFSLAAKGKSGSSTVIVYEAVFENSATIQPKLTYTAGGKSYSTNLDAVVITVGNPGVEFVITPSATKAEVGEEVSFDLAITNSGNVDFDSFYVYDNLDNMVALDQETLAMGQSIEASHKMIISETTQVKFIAAAQDADGNEYEFTSDDVTIEVALGASGAELFTLNVEADKTELTEEGEILFSLTLENKSSQPYTDVVINEETLGEITSYTSFPNGKKILQYSITMAESQNFVFTLTATAPDGSAVKYTAPAIQVNVEGSGGISTLTIILIIVIALIIAVAVVLVILVLRDKNGPDKGGSKVSRGQSKQKSKNGGFLAGIFGSQKTGSKRSHPAESAPRTSARPPQRTYSSRPSGVQSDNMYKNGSRNYVQGTTSADGVRHSNTSYEIDPAPAATPHGSFEPVSEQPEANVRPHMQNRKRFEFDDHNDF